MIDHSQDNFNISNGFDGSAFSYTINYSDSTSRETCGSDTIQASDCVGMICTHTLKINPPSSCLSSTAGVSITVIATNALGNGPASDPVVFIIPECDGSIINIILFCLSFKIPFFSFIFRLKWQR